MDNMSTLTGCYDLHFVFHCSINTQHECLENISQNRNKDVESANSQSEAERYAETRAKSVGGLLTFHILWWYIQHRHKLYLFATINVRVEIINK